MRIFSDPDYVYPGVGHVAMLYPFWGVDSENPQHPAAGRYDEYAQLGDRYFELVPLEEADVAVLPMPWEQVLASDEAMLRAKEFIALARSAHKDTIVFYWSDSAEPVPFSNTIVFRTSLYRSRRSSNEFAMPAWSEDFVTKYLGGELRLRPKSALPVVGFCGYSAPMQSHLRWGLESALGKVNRILQSPQSIRTSEIPGPILRSKAIRLLSRSRLIQSNFSLRKKFLAGALLSDGSLNFDRYQAARREYVQNMVESDYILCIRGGGNFSYRLYETMSTGRIPILVNTDCVLPYDWDIDWKDYTVWIDVTDIDHLAERVFEHHSNLSRKQFVDLQLRCRQLWEERLSPLGFFQNLHRHLQGEQNGNPSKGSERRDG